MRVTILHNYRDEQQPSMRLYADRLGNALVRQGISVSRVRPPEVVPEAWRDRSLFWKKIDTYVGRFAVYPRLVREMDTDVVHIVDHGQGYLVPRVDPKRALVTCHDVILLVLAKGRIGGAAIPPIALQLFRLSMEHVKAAGAVVADSAQTKRDLVDLVGIDPDKITVIYPGLNQAFQPDPSRRARYRERFGLGSGLLMLHIGRTFYKNISGVLRVLERLRRDGVDVRLVRIGRALEGKERSLAESLGVKSSVIELGAVPDDDIPGLYNAVDLLLFPSLYEGFGWPPLEAMASGTSVVCSRAGSLGEVVGDAALTAEPEAIDMLAWHAGQLLTNEDLRAKTIDRGLTHAARFSWDRTAREMIAVYERLAGA